MDFRDGSRIISPRSFPGVMMHRASARAFAAAMLLATPCALAGAQAQPAPKDTVQRDSVLRGPPDNWGLLPVMVALAGTAIVAPPALLFLPDLGNADTSALFLAGNHVFVYGSAGGGGDVDNRNYWAMQHGVELFMGGVYGEARVEQFGLHERNVRLRAFRVGYLARVRGVALGGVTVGYRVPGGEGELRGVEIGLPLIMGSGRGDTRLEPIYLISNQGVSWNYRLQMELRLPNTPLTIGGRFTWHTFDAHGSANNVDMNLILGVLR